MLNLKAKHPIIRFLLLSILLHMPTIAFCINQNDTIAIICLNDFHGGFVHDERLGTPGAGNIFTAVSNIKKRYQSNLVVAVGDNFGGSFFSNQTRGDLIPYFFNKLGINVSALGNHEFDNGQDFLKEKWGDKKPAGWNIKYICGNLEEKETHRNPSYAISDTICKVKSNGKDVSIALMGLITSSAASATKKENVTGLVFKRTYSEILNNLCKEESVKNSDIKVLVAHIGTEMKCDSAKWEESGVDLPEAIKGIASGHSHKRVEGFINGVPIVQGGILGKYLGVLRFAFIGNKWSPCSPLLLKVDDVKDESDERKEIDSIVSARVNNTMAYGLSLSCRIANVSTSGGLIHDRNVNNKKLTALGSYVCMSYAYAYRKFAGKENMDNIILSFCHFGGIRSSLPYGNVDVKTAGEVLPFANKLRVYELSGKEIRKVIEAGISCQKGLLQMSNLRVDTIHYNGKCRVLNIHYIVPNKKDVILKDMKKYPVVVDEFIATGGDGYDEKLFPTASWKREIQCLYTTPSFLNFLWTLTCDMSENYIYKAKFNNAE